MNEEQSLGTLLKGLRDDTTLLVKEEIALAKTEISEKASIFGRNLGFLVAGALVGFSGLIVTLVGFGFLISNLFVNMGMDLAMSHFLGMLIIGLLVIIISSVLVMKAIATLKEESLVPKQTVETLKDDKDWAANKIK